MLTFLLHMKKLIKQSLQPSGCNWLLVSEKMYIACMVSLTVYNRLLVSEKMYIACMVSLTVFNWLLVSEKMYIACMVSLTVFNSSHNFSFCVTVSPIFLSHFLQDNHHENFSVTLFTPAYLPWIHIPRCTHTTELVLTLKVQN